MSRWGWPWRWRREASGAGQAAEQAGARTCHAVPIPRRPPDGPANRLADRWCATSMATGWATPGKWWTPAIDSVVDALLDDADQRSACAALARQRAVDGVSLAETVDDIGALFAAARLGSPPYEIVRAVALAWGEAAHKSIAAAGCTDPRTGLGTATHVEARLAEMYTEGRKYGFSPSETHALVIIELDIVGENGDPWNNNLRMSDVAECLRTVFDAGQVMGVTGPGRLVVVAARATGLPRTVEGLRRMMQDWRGSGSGPGPMIWVESLPVAQVAAERLLSTLCA